MVDYWGAQAHYFSGGPNGEGTRYFMPESDPNFMFTMPSGDHNSTKIEVIKMQIENQHPEWISTLADEWFNVYNLLFSISQQLWTQSNTLYNEHWKSAEARDAFMRMGPGETLAYLDEWMDAALNNVNGLRAMVGIVRQSRADMDALWREYQQAVEDAKNVDGWTTAWEFSWHYDLFGGDQREYHEAMAKHQVEQINAKHDEYNKKAQDLAYRVANQIFETYSKISSGHGPPFVPPDAVLNVPGHPPWIGSGPPTAGAPPAPPPPNLPAAVAPVSPPVTNPQALQEQLLATINPPPVTAVQAPPTSSVGAPTAPPPPVLPVALAAPLGPLAISGLGVPPGLTTNAPATGAAGLQSPGAPPGAAGKLGKAGNLGPAGLKDGVLKGKAAPSQPADPHTGLKSPMAPPIMGNKGMTKQPTTSAHGKEPPGLMEPALEEAFGRPPMSTSPPVLNAQRPKGRRPGSREEMSPSGHGTNQTGQPLAGRPATAPPVLSSPGSTGASGLDTGATPGPGPLRAQPPMPGRPGRRKSERTGASGQPIPQGADWIGLEAARVDTSAPVLDAPDAPPSGAAASGLEEVPTTLRAGGGTATGRVAAPAQRRGTVPPELAARRTKPASGRSAAGQVDHADERQIVTDEEAFSVDTPGGGVLAKQPEDKSYRAEPPAALGGA